MEAVVEGLVPERPSTPVVAAVAVIVVTAKNAK